MRGQVAPAPFHVTGGTADLREGLCADEQCLAVPILAHNSPNSRMARAARYGYEAFV